MSDIHHEVISHASEDKAHSALNTKVIWKVFWILLGVTIFEVGIAFTSISPEAVLSRRTVIRFSVRVPVLSVRNCRLFVVPMNTHRRGFSVT